MFRLRLPASIAILTLATIVHSAAAQTPAAQESAGQEATSPEQLGRGASAAPPEATETTEPGSISEGSAASGEETEARQSEPAASVSNAQKPEVSNLTVSTWGGAYGEALRNEVLTPFGSARGVEIDRVAAGDGGLSGDVVELTAAGVEAGCNSGELIKIDAVSLAGAAADDFIPGSVQPCGAGSFIWSAVMAMNEKALTNGQAAVSQAISLQDVFNTAKFPGRRAFIRSPRYLLEMALIADGVAPADVYQQLGSDEGVERALAKLDSLGEDLTWHAGAKETQAQLADGGAIFAQTFNGRAFYAAAFGAPVRVIWDGQVYSANYWAIPANGDAQELAKDFIAHAMAPERLAAVAEETGYGPARRSAIALARQHPRVGIELASFLPTQADNLERAVAFDEAWWHKHRARIEARFAAWLEAREPAPMLKPERRPE